MSTPAPTRSPWAIARRRFLRNIPATLGLAWLLLNALAAIFAYWLIPDGSTHANFQVVQLPKQPPGTAVTLLLQPIHPHPEMPGPFGQLLHGHPDAHVPIPVRAVTPPVDITTPAETIDPPNLKGHYVDLKGKTQELDIARFLLPMDPQAPDYTIENDGRIHYRHSGGWNATAGLDSLRTAFSETHVATRTFTLGTDGAGRDVLSRLILGGRVTLGIGLMAVLVSLLIGVTMGSLAGFFGGWVDSIVMGFSSVVWSIPTLLLAIALAYGLGKGAWQLFLAIGAGTWVDVARITRGQILSLRETQYVEAARALGYGPFRTILRHVLPNAAGPLIVVAAANFAAAVLVESGLSFLGVGIQPPAPSWGGMIREGYTQVMFDSGAWLAFWPGMAIVLVVVALNMVGNGLNSTK